MNATDLDRAGLLELLARGEGRDRAFVDGVLRLRWPRTSGAGERRELDELLGAVRDAAARSHTALRARIASGALRGAALRRIFDDVPVFERDHVVEEVLGIAYPPLEEAVLGPELTPYMPSGYDEIVHALDATRLGTGDRFLDIGSGTGKVALLAALLCDATVAGVECTRALNDLAVGAAKELRVPNAHFETRDARDVRDAHVEDADVVFMYLPFTGSVLASVLERVMERARSRPASRRRRFLCAGSLDLGRWTDLVAAGEPKSWLHIYAWR